MLPAYLFIYNIYLIVIYKDFDKNNISISHKSSIKLLIIIGMIFALITVLRFHLLPEICFAILYCCYKKFRYSFKYILFGYLLLFIPLGGILDWITLGYPFQSIIKNIDLNILHGVADEFGSAPFYYYFYDLLMKYNLFIIPIGYFAYLGWKKYPIIMWVGIINFLVFSCISHKEFRFIFLFNLCLCTSAGIGVALFFSKNKIKLSKIKDSSVRYKYNKDIMRCYFLFLLFFLFLSCSLAVKLSSNQSMLFIMKLSKVIKSELQNKVGLVYQFNTYGSGSPGKYSVDSWCGSGYAALNLDVPYLYQGCGHAMSNAKYGNLYNTGGYGFFSSYQSNLERIKLLIVPKDKWVISGQKIYCYGKYCAYSYPEKVTYSKYYLWETLPFII